MRYAVSDKFKCCFQAAEPSAKRNGSAAAVRTRTAEPFWKRDDFPYLKRKHAVGQAFSCPRSGVFCVGKTRFSFAGA